MALLGAIVILLYPDHIGLDQSLFWRAQGISHVVPKFLWPVVSIVVHYAFEFFPAQFGGTGSISLKGLNFIIPITTL